MINKAAPFKGRNIGIPIILPIQGTGFMNQGSTLPPEQSWPGSGGTATYSSPSVDRIWLWVNVKKIPIYPIFYLLKGGYMHFKAETIPSQVSIQAKMLGIAPGPRESSGMSKSPRKQTQASLELHLPAV